MHDKLLQNLMVQNNHSWSQELRQEIVCLGPEVEDQRLGLESFESYFT
jgi:hypothetical protein